MVLNIKASTLDTWIWVLIYGGLIGVGLGLSVQRTAVVLGWCIVSTGTVGALLGAALVVVRSRQKEPQ